MRPTPLEIISNMREKNFREEIILEEVEKELTRLASKGEGKEDVKDEFYIWNGIDGELQEVDSVNDLKDYIKDYTDQEEGIHPDIESIFALKKVASVVCVPIEGKEDTFKVQISPAQSPSCSPSKVFEVIDTVKAQYPTSVFPDNGTSPDSKAAFMARLICDNIKREMEIMLNEEPGLPEGVSAEENYVDKILHGLAPCHRPTKSYREVVYGLRSALTFANDLPHGSALTGWLCEVSNLIWDYERMRLQSEKENQYASSLLTQRDAEIEEKNRWLMECRQAVVDHVKTIERLNKLLSQQQRSD